MKKFLLFATILLSGFQAFSQQNVGIGTTTPEQSAILDLVTNNKGFLVPRVTQAERLAILNPARGLMVYDIDADCFFFFSNIWVPLCQSNGPLSGTINAPSLFCNQGAPTNASNAGFTFDNDKDSGLFGIRLDNTTPTNTMTELRMYLNGSEKMRIASTRTTFGGDVYATGSFINSAGFQSCSDYRFKKDFMPITSALANIGQIQAYTYFWKQDEFPAYGFNNREQIGFIAQEIEKVYPQVVNTDANGYKSVDYSKLTPVLLVAINELNAKITKLEGENNALKAKVEGINNGLKQHGIDVDSKVENK